MAAMSPASTPSASSSAVRMSEMGLLKLMSALTSYPPEKRRVSSNAAPNAAVMNPVTTSVKTTMENIASVIPVRKRDAIGYAMDVRITGARLRFRPNTASSARVSKSELYITVHTAPSTIITPDTMNRSKLTENSPPRNGSNHSNGKSHQPTSASPAMV